MPRPAITLVLWGRLSMRTGRRRGLVAPGHGVRNVEVTVNDSGVVTERDPDTLRGADVAFYCFARVPRESLPRARYLDVPGFAELSGAGIYYGAALTEARSCADQHVVVIGGANSAGQAAIYFSKYARRVVMLVRGDSLSASMSQYLIDQIKKTPNIQVEAHARVSEVHGDSRLEAISIHCGDSGQNDRVPANSLFVFIGAEPNTDWLAGVVERDERGFILTGADLMRDGKRPPGWPPDRDPYLTETSIPGIFAAGDVRHGSVKRVASGVGEGAMAVQFIHQYLGPA